VKLGRILRRPWCSTRRWRNLAWAGLLLVGVLGARGETLGEGWHYRRKLDVKPLPSDAPGDNLAWTEFYTNGTHRPDGADFRITNVEGVVLPLRVMQASGDDDLVRLAFVTRGSAPFYVSWGNPKADKPGPLADIRRGVLCDIFKGPGGALGTEQHIRDMFGRAKIFEGSIFVPQIFQGYNPLGDEWNSMFRYRAQFKVDKAGSYDFGFAVHAAGYLAVDGKTIVVIGNRGPEDARNHHAMDLNAGWHDVEVAQVNVNGNMSVSLSWRRPGDGRFELLPPAIFAPVAEAAAGPLQTIGTPYTVDFSVHPMAEAFAPPDHYLQRYAFDAEAVPPGATLHWDFGDGQSAGNDPHPSHIYITPGVYTVTLAVKPHAVDFKGTRRLTVKDRMYRRFPNPPSDPFKTVSAVLERYTPTTLAAEQRLRGMQYFIHEAAADSALQWGKAWEESGEAQDEQTVWEETSALASLCETRGNLLVAADMYRLAANKPLSMEMRLRCLRWWAIAACDYGADPAEVLKTAELWQPKLDRSNNSQRHALLTIIAYAAVAKGDGKLAAQTCRDAGTRRNMEFNDMEVHRGVLARNIETYIRTRDFETAQKLITQWEIDTPEAIIEGFTRLLKVKLLVSQNRHAAAARVAQQLVRANPESFYGAELLYRAVEALKEGGKTAEANTVLNTLKDKYPESPYARGDKVKIE